MINHENRNDSVGTDKRRRKLNRRKFIKTKLDL